MNGHIPIPEDLTTLNAQYVLDQTVYKLRSQGGVCVAGNGNCVYRGDNNCRCAFGWWILDESYFQTLETKPIDSIIRETPILIPLVPYRTLLTLIQRCHDHALVNARREFACEWAPGPMRIPVGISSARPAGIAWALDQVAQEFDINPNAIYKSWPQAADDPNYPQTRRYILWLKEQRVEIEPIYYKG